MSKEKNMQIIEGIEDILAKSDIGIMTDFRGMSTVAINDLRRKLRESGVEYHVVKNTLARYAARKLGRDDLAGLFEGQVALACGHGDATKPAKVIVDYVRTSKSALKVKGGFLASRLLTVKDIDTLCTLPSREILLAKVLGGMQSPIVIFVSLLVSPIRGILGVLQARIKQLEGA